MLINESVHNDDLGKVIGYFHDLPVRAWDAEATKNRELRDVEARINDRKDADAKRALKGESSFVYVVPDHEYVDKYGIIRPRAELTNGTQLAKAVGA